MIVSNQLQDVPTIIIGAPKLDPRRFFGDLKNASEMIIDDLMLPPNNMIGDPRILYGHTRRNNDHPYPCKLATC